MRKVRRKRNILREMIDKRDQAIANEETVQDVINELLEEKTFIENIDQVIAEVLRRYELKVKHVFVRKQMQQLRLVYRKVKQIAI